MPCYHPISGYWSAIVNDSGKRSLVFDSSKSAFPNAVVKVPCGRCIGCRLEYSRQWAVRCVHEASLHENNSFITLTYSDGYMPSDGSLHVEDFQKFMKRLRKRIEPNKVRFFHCGEYGEQLGRPHYHACLFGFDFEDKVLFKDRAGVKLYVSPMLQDLWEYGFSTVGEVNFDSAAYVARYVMKKIKGSTPDQLDAHYCGRKPEYVTMSRRPGIAADWYKKFKSDMYPSDFLVLNGAKMKPPRFYDNRFEHDDLEVMLEIRRKRLARARSPGVAMHSTPERLEVREEVKLAQVSFLKRDIDF